MLNGQVKQMHLLEVETFASTFGPKSTRKKPKVQSLDYDSLLKVAETKASSTPPQDTSFFAQIRHMTPVFYPRFQLILPKKTRISNY